MQIIATMAHAKTLLGNQRSSDQSSGYATLYASRNSRRDELLVGRDSKTRLNVSESDKYLPMGFDMMRTPDTAQPITLAMCSLSADSVTCLPIIKTNSWLGTVAEATKMRATTSNKTTTCEIMAWSQRHQQRSRGDWEGRTAGKLDNVPVLS